MTQAAGRRSKAADFRPDPAARHEPFPLTDMQHAYWLGRGGALELGNVSCHVYFEWRLEALDVGRFERAWDGIIRRHDMLRSIVLPTGDQRVLPDPPPYRIVVDDLTSLTPAARSSRLAATRDRMMHQVLDAATWPLFEVRVSTLDAGDVRVHIDFDLLTVDVQSFHIILGELERRYADPALDLPPLTVSFRDCVMAAEQARAGATYAAHRAWWLERLERLPAAPELPLARAPQTIERPRFVKRTAVLEAPVWQRLSAIAGARGITGSAVLLAAFAEVLGQWSRSPEFCVNLTHFNRERLHPEVTAIVGDFTSVVLIACTDGDGATTFAERAKRLQRETWSALGHSAFNGVEVARELARRSPHPRRGSLMPVVFTSLLGLDIDALIATDGSPRLLSEPLVVHTSTPQVWFDHQAMIRGGRLIYNWITIDELFPQGLVAAMFEAYEQLIVRLADDERAWDQPTPALLPPTQRRVRAAANATAADMAPRCLHTGLLEHASAQPTRPAVVDAQGTVSYGDLDRASTALALRLRRGGLGLGDRAIVALPRGRHQVVATLGVLKAGGAYVPVAADAPPARAEAIAADAGAAVVITDRLDVIWPECAVRLTSRDLDRVEADVEADDLDHVTPGALAYVIYTSGSTGTPKGVALTHAAAWNTIADVNRRLAVGPADRALALSSLTFDLSVWDLFGLLAAGGAVVIPDAARGLDPLHWLDCIRRHDVTLWNSVPALLDLLLDACPATEETCLPLRAVMLSGDWVPLSQPARVRAVVPEATFVAMGGATEAAIWSNWLTVTDVPADWPSIPYGFPLANQSYRVLDRRGRDRPDWVAGDLYIGGRGVALGYWNDAARTAASFVTATDTGERLYRTGDLGRYWPDGTLEFLGREDTQVKIAGHRIELREIEAVLERCPGVRDAVAVVAEHRGTRRLEAFVVPSDDHCTTAGDGDGAAVAEAVAAVEAGADRAALRAAIALQEAADRLACLAMRRALDRLATTQQPPRAGFEPLVRQWQRTVDDTEPAAPEALAAAVDDLRAQATSPGTQPLVDWIVTSSINADKMLLGDLDPLALLFPDGTFDRAESLYRDNPIARHLNAIAAAMARVVASRRRGPLRVLEVGAGSGSTTEALLEVPALADAAYLFTDITRFFLDAARIRLAARAGLSFETFDINKAPATQGMGERRFDLVVASNVLHDARDLPRTLTWLRELLDADGHLLVIEATRNTPVQMVTAGFLEGFSAFADARAATGLPLVSAAGWRQLLTAAGFTCLEAAPRGDDVGQHVFLAQRRGGLDVAAIRREAQRFLPAYMLPAAIHQLDDLPLGANGKVDRRTLGRLAASDAPKPTADGPALTTPSEQRLAAIWSDVLGTPITDADADFFESGGDSLLAIRLLNRVRSVFGHEVPARAVFDAPRLDAFAALLDRSPAPQPEGGDRPRLVLFPGSDGSSLVFRELEAALADALMVDGIDLASADVDRFADGALDATVDLASARLGKAPALLGGWSSGAFAAATLARQLQQQGRPGAGLVLIDPVDWRHPAYFTERFQRLGQAIPAPLRPIVGAQLQTLVDFTPDPCTTPALVLWAARHEPDWPEAASAWERVLRGPLTVHRIEADHWSMLADPTAARQVAAHIADFVAGLAPFRSSATP